MEFLIVLLLIIANGVFAMSEAAMISARKARLQERAEEGDASAEAALKLSQEPTAFLSTVQIGITLIGILSGAVGGTALARYLTPILQSVPALAPYAEALSLTLVVLLITYLSLVIGELVPKQLALNNAEGIAARVARPMGILARITAPLVTLLSLSTRFVLWALRVRPSTEPPVTEEEVKILIEQGRQAGVFEPAEQNIVENVFRLGDWRIRAVMVPRTAMISLDMDDPLAHNLEIITRTGYSYYPVFQRDMSNLLGLLPSKALLKQMMDGQTPDIEALITEPLFVPENMPALNTLEQFRQTGKHIALVIEEHGGIEGLVTITDILEAIVGDLPEEHEINQEQYTRREDGSWLIDGMLNIEEVEDLLDLRLFPEDERGDYDTLGGFMMKRLGRIPEAADVVDWNGVQLEVVDMDGYRVDKVLISYLDGS